MKTARAIDWSETTGTESALAERCAAGDAPACQELVDEHQRMVYHLAFQLLGHHEDALDLSQDVFLTVFRSIHQFRGDSALQTWIYRIVVNHVRNRQRWWRRRRRSGEVSLDAVMAEHGEPAAPTASTSPERALDQKELSQRLWRALGRLPSLPRVRAPAGRAGPVDREAPPSAVLSSCQRMRTSCHSEPAGEESRS